MSRATRPTSQRDSTPGRRIFVAAPIPAAAAASVASIVDSVRAEPLPAGGRDVRWVRLDGLHVTLRYLGPTEEARIDDVVRAMERAVVGRSAFEVTLGGSGTFPASGRPRTLWLALDDGAEEFASLARRLDDGLVEAGWATDDRPFRAHLTLARADGIPAGRLVAERLAAATSGLEIRCVVDRLGVYESVTGGGPARYVPLASAALASAQ
jgi:2'-5' RNA ligase